MRSHFADLIANPTFTSHMVSQAFVTFAEQSAASAALASNIFVKNEAMEEVVLVTKRAAVEAELTKSESGALARTWATQETKLAAAIKIQFRPSTQLLLNFLPFLCDIR